MFKNVIAILKDDSGQGLVEYGLILTFVSIVAISALTLLGTNIKGVLNTVAGDL
jgi:pilus assembly protein Flp/PilA